MPPLEEEQLNKLVESTRKLQVRIDFNSWLGSEFLLNGSVGREQL